MTDSEGADPKMQAAGSFSCAYRIASACHPVIGEPVEFIVPTAALHRPAVKTVLSGEYYEKFTHSAFHDILAYKNVKTVVHAGAFFGDMLHTLSKFAGRVHAFEPVLENYVLAKLNAMRWQLPNVLLMNAGLSDSNGIAFMRTTDRFGRFAGGSSTLLPAGTQPNEHVEPVTILRLDDQPITDLAIIQLDVEGHELRALQGATSLIERWRPILMLEDNANACSEFLKARGYAWVFQRDGLHYWGSPDDIPFLERLKGRETAPVR